MANSTANKRPRHYAAEIIGLPTRAERTAKLEQSPPDWRGLIDKHVRNYFALRNHRRVAA